MCDRTGDVHTVMKLNPLQMERTAGKEEYAAGRELE